jgi:hypothetical protein
LRIAPRTAGVSGSVTDNLDLVVVAADRALHESDFQLLLLIAHDCSL